MKKTMTCLQLGGACEVEFCAETFEEIAEMSKSHGMEMFKNGDQKHLEAMAEMKKRMEKPGAMEKWFANKKKEFESL